MINYANFRDSTQMQLNKPNENVSNSEFSVVLDNK